MTFVFWLIGIWFSGLLVFYAMCALGAYVNFLRDSHSPAEVLHNVAIDCPVTINSVTLFYEPALFYEPGLVKFQQGPPQARRGTQANVHGGEVSSRLTSYPCGI
jgi:hypothetical protein